MAADWAALTRYLSGKGESVALSWRDLEDIVGGMPASALDHAAWWSGDRPHTRSWRAAGFEVGAKTPGVRVLFVRIGTRPAAKPLLRDQTERAQIGVSPTSRIVLLSCAKQKAAKPSPARDLYTSPRFRKARAYAETSGSPWFILSAAHGLVSPDDWLAPYDLYLGDTTPAYRRVWGSWVVARLELALGALAGRTIEIHAGSDYVTPIRSALESRGAEVELPLIGLRSGQVLAWYGDLTAGRGTKTRWAFTGDVGPWLAAVSSVEHSVQAADLAAVDLPAAPGLYGWFADEAAADDLSRGLGEAVSPGLVYVGQTGATKWPTGTRSGATLRGRIRSQHLGGRRSSSTLRRTFGAILDAAHGRFVERAELSAWMVAHLRVATKATSDVDTLGDLERQVVQALDPPLNLDHTSPSPARAKLRELRRNAPAGIE